MHPSELLACVARHTTMSKDPLQFLPLERWSELQSALKTDWPRSISGYTALETQRSLRERGLSYGFTVYCPYGDMWNGMVAINEKVNFYELIIMCARDDTEKLDEALRKTQIIDWDRFVIVAFAPEHVIKCLQKLSHVEVDILLSEFFYLDKPVFFEDVSLPPNLSFGQLTDEHLDLVDSTWPHRYPSSPWYFKFLISTKASYGLFQDNELIAWVFFNESGNLLHMYTVESERNKGYAELLLKIVSNILLKEGKPVIAYCVYNNVKACNLYSKHFTKAPLSPGWCYVNKKVVSCLVVLF